MSVSLPNNNAEAKPINIGLPTNSVEKKARYRMLVNQRSITMQQARKYYKDYLLRLRG